VKLFFAYGKQSRALRLGFERRSGYGSTSSCRESVPRPEWFDETILSRGRNSKSRSKKNSEAIFIAGRSAGSTSSWLEARLSEKRILGASQDSLRAFVFKRSNEWTVPVRNFLNLEKV